MASPDKNFISILAVKQGIDPIKDIEWRAYPADLLGVALQKGEVQAFSGPDPIVSIIRDRDHLMEVTNNLSGEFEHRACCILGVRGTLVRDERPVAAAITAAMMEAQEWVAGNPDAAEAAIFAGFYEGGDRGADACTDAAEPLHPPSSSGQWGSQARDRFALCRGAETGKTSVFKSSTDPVQFADRVCVDVLAA